VRDGGFRAAGLRQPEVENLHSTVRPDLDIRRFQIAIHDAFFVRGFQSIGAIRFAIPRASSSGIAPCAIRSASVGPSINSLPGSSAQRRAGPFASYPASAPKSKQNLNN